MVDGTMSRICSIVLRLNAESDLYLVAGMLRDNYDFLWAANSKYFQGVIPFSPLQWEKTTLTMVFYEISNNSYTTYFRREGRCVHEFDNYPCA